MAGLVVPKISVNYLHGLGAPDHHRSCRTFRPLIIVWKVKLIFNVVLSCVLSGIDTKLCFNQLLDSMQQDTRMQATFQSSRRFTRSAQQCVPEILADPSVLAAYPSLPAAAAQFPPQRQVCHSFRPDHSEANL